jgi:predicted DNA-binding transcriptional regulator AlpA
VKSKSPSPIPPDLEQYRTINDHLVAQVTGLALGTIRNKRADGTGPTYYRVGRRCVYRLSEVLSWMEARKVDRAG